jgi:hypothetical protein
VIALALKVKGNKNIREEHGATGMQTTDEMFIHEINKRHYHCELAESETAAYTPFLAPTLPPMHTQLSAHTQRAFCSRHLPIRLSIFTDHQAQTGSAA